MVFPIIFFVFALFLNGATDAANSVTGAVASKALKKSTAMPLASLCEALGSALFILLFPSVARFMKSTLSFDFSEKEGVLIICISLLSVIIWSGAAWLMALPTSEGHALIAAMSGCAAAMGERLSPGSATAVFVGIFASCVGAVLLSVFGVSFLKNLKSKEIPLRRFSIVSLMVSAFIHGAQDGQKFAGLALCAGLFTCEWHTALVCAAAMGLGTFCGGGRIVEKIGNDATSTTLFSSCIADISGGVCLFLLTLLGVPASTTHAKISALCASGAAETSRLDKKIISRLILAWVLTFPLCRIVAFSLFKLALQLNFCI